MKIEEVLSAYREGKDITCGLYIFNKDLPACRLKDAEEWQILCDKWEIKKEKEKITKYPVLIQDIGYWLPPLIPVYFVSTIYFKSLEEAKETYSDRHDLKVIRLITEIPELIQEEEV